MNWRSDWKPIPRSGAFSSSSENSWNPEFGPAQFTGNLAQMLGTKDVGHGPKMAQSCIFGSGRCLARPLLIRVWSQAIQVFK
jgi:hypothetical protein